MERQECVIDLVSRAFREDTDRNSGMNFFDAFQNRFHTLLDILSVQKQTVQILHPVTEQRNPQDFFFGDIAPRV